MLMLKFKKTLIFSVFKLFRQSLFIDLKFLPKHENNDHIAIVHPYLII